MGGLFVQRMWGWCGDVCWGWVCDAVKMLWGCVGDGWWMVCAGDESERVCGWFVDGLGMCSGLCWECVGDGLRFGLILG